MWMISDGVEKKKYVPSSKYLQEWVVFEIQAKTN
jgi:hypothetical protein